MTKPTTTPPGTHTDASSDIAEHRRLAEDARGEQPWKRWGPYLSERQWGTVREDYSPNGAAWEYLSHDAARSRAYRWGEDGLAGLSDDSQLLCLAVALWNGRPHSEGAPVRPDEQRRQPRRGCEGALLLSRRHADAFVPENALQVSAARVSVRCPGGREPAPHEGRTRVRTDRHGHLRGEPLLRCVRRVCQGRPGRHPDAYHGAQSRPRAGLYTRAAAALVSQHLVVDRWCRETRAARSATMRHWRQPSGSRELHAALRGRRDAAVLRQRYQCGARVRIRRAGLLQGCLPRVRGRRSSRRGQSATCRYEGRRAPCAHRGGRRREAAPAAPHGRAVSGRAVHRFRRDHGVATARSG